MSSEYTALIFNSQKIKMPCIHYTSQVLSIVAINLEITFCMLDIVTNINDTYTYALIKKSILYRLLTFH